MKSNFRTFGNGSACLASAILSFVVLAVAANLPLPPNSPIPPPPPPPPPELPIPYPPSPPPPPSASAPRTPLEIAIVEAMKTPSPSSRPDDQLRVVTVNGVNYVVHTMVDVTLPDGSVDAVPLIEAFEPKPSFSTQESFLNTLFGSGNATQVEIGNALIHQGLFPWGTAFPDLSSLPEVNARIQNNQQNLANCNCGGSVVPVINRGQAGFPDYTSPDAPPVDRVFGSGFVIQDPGTGGLTFITAEHVQMTHTTSGGQSLIDGGVFGYSVSQGPNVGIPLAQGSQYPIDAGERWFRPDVTFKALDPTAAQALGLSGGGYVTMPDRPAVGTEVIVPGYAGYNFNSASSDRALVAARGTIVGYDTSGQMMIRFRNTDLPVTQGMSGAPVLLASDPRTVVGAISGYDPVKIGENGSGVSVATTLVRNAGGSAPATPGSAVLLNLCSSSQCSAGEGLQINHPLGLAAPQDAITRALEPDPVSVPELGNAPESNRLEAQLQYDIAVQEWSHNVNATLEANLQAYQGWADSAIAHALEQVSVADLGVTQGIDVSQNLQAAQNSVAQAETAAAAQEQSFDSVQGSLQSYDLSSIDFSLESGDSLIGAHQASLDLISISIGEISGAYDMRSLMPTQYSTVDTGGLGTSTEEVTNALSPERSASFVAAAIRAGVPVQNAVDSAGQKYAFVVLPPSLGGVTVRVPISQ